MKKCAPHKRFKYISLGSAMADIALLLLIFFMVSTTTDLPKGADVELPSAKTAGVEQDCLFVTISRNRRIYFDNKPVGLAELGDSLAMRSCEKDRAVTITADRELDFATVAPLLSVLKKNGYLNLVFMSQPRKEAPGQ